MSQRRIVLTDPHSAPAEYLARVSTFVRYRSELGGWIPSLFDHCWIMEIADGEHWLAIVWYNWIDPVQHAIETHAVSSTTARGRWLDRRVRDAHWEILKRTGAQVATAQITSPLAGRIWKWFGYDLGENKTATKELQWVASAKSSAP
jgi:hypothetical protein